MYPLQQEADLAILEVRRVWFAALCMKLGNGSGEPTQVLSAWHCTVLLFIISGLAAPLAPALHYALHFPLPVSVLLNCTCLTEVRRLGLLWAVREVTGETQLSCAELPPGTALLHWVQVGSGVADAWGAQPSALVRQDEPGTNSLISACIWRQSCSYTCRDFLNPWWLTILTEVLSYWLRELPNLSMILCYLTRKRSF